MAAQKPAVAVHCERSPFAIQVMIGIDPYYVKHILDQEPVHPAVLVGCKRDLPGVVVVFPALWNTKPGFRDRLMSPIDLMEPCRPVRDASQISDPLGRQRL